MIMKKIFFMMKNLIVNLKKYVNKTFNYENVSDIYLQPYPNMKLYKKSLIEENNIQFP